MTERQRQIARHMLFGSSASKRSFRNFYVADAKHVNFPTLVEMERAGFVSSDRGRCCWFLTRAAAESVLLPGESLDPEDFPS